MDDQGAPVSFMQSPSAAVQQLPEPIRPIARNVKRLRLERSMSLSALAKAARISKSTLFGIEQGKGNPAVDTLWSLAGALGVPIGVLFVDPAQASVDVVRYDEAPVVNSDRKVGFPTRHLLSSRPGGQFEVYWIDVEPHVRRVAPEHSAGVLEHVVIVAGELEMTIDDRSTVLHRGDRMTFAADRQHTYATSEQPARLIVLMDYL